MQHLKYTRKSAGSMQNMYLVTHEINDAILGLLSEEIMYIEVLVLEDNFKAILSVKIFQSLLFFCQCLVIVEQI